MPPLQKRPDVLLAYASGVCFPRFACTRCIAPLTSVADIPYSDHLMRLSVEQPSNGSNTNDGRDADRGNVSRYPFGSIGAYSLVKVPVSPGCHGACRLDSLLRPGTRRGKSAGVNCTRSHVKPR